MSLSAAERTYPRVDLPNMPLTDVDWSRTVLHQANLAGADLSRSDFSRADFLGADLTGAIMHRTDLTGARNLTVEQLREAVIDETTILPDYIDRAALRARGGTGVPRVG